MEIERFRSESEHLTKNSFNFSHSWLHGTSKVSLLVFWRKLNLFHSLLFTFIVLTGMEYYVQLELKNTIFIIRRSLVRRAQLFKG